jgi:hypothetical protein
MKPGVGRRQVLVFQPEAGLARLRLPVKFKAASLKSTTSFYNITMAPTKLLRPDKEKRLKSILCELIRSRDGMKAQLTSHQQLLQRLWQQN